MPYTKLSDAHLRELDNVPFTLEQANWLAALAEKIGGDFGWPTAIKQFRHVHEVVAGHWVTKKTEGKELSQDVLVEKEADGRFRILSISTVAVPDLVGETFTAKAMDWENPQHKELGVYPEYDLFHNKNFGIGMVEKMGRVGIFGIEEGHSYTDPFSLSVCEKMLEHNDGTWRNSRAFWAYEIQGHCPKCNSLLGIAKEHLIVGYKCPNCQSTLLGYKGVLKDIQFTKTWTFGITVTDNPCVPFTGVTAFRSGADFKTILEETMKMSKEEWKEKLLASGVDAGAVDERFSKISDEQWKELNMDDVPEAKLLKELEEKTAPVTPEVPVEPEETPVVPEVSVEPVAPVAKEETITLDPTVLAQFAEVVRPVVEAVVKEIFGKMEIEIPDLKDQPEFKQLAADMAEVKKIITASSIEQLKEVVKDMPRQGQLRVVRFKSEALPEPVVPAEEKQDGSKAVVMGVDGKASPTFADWLYPKPQ